MRVTFDDGEEREGIVEEVEPERRIVVPLGRLARRVDARDAPSAAPASSSSSAASRAVVGPRMAAPQAHGARCALA